MPTREATLRDGEHRLREWGVGPGADVAALRAVVGRDTAADLAIAARLGTHAEPASVEALQVLESGSRDKLVHKEVRRSLYRLSQRGLALPAAEPVAAAPRPVLGGPALEGYVSAVDGAGDHLVWLVRPVPGGILHLLAVVNDPEGLKEVGLSETTRKTLREARESLRDKHDLRMVEADWQHCDFVIGRALRWAHARGHTVSGDYTALRAQLTSQPPASDLAPLIEGRLTADAVRADARTLLESAAVLEEPEFRTWFFGPDELKPYLDEMRHVRDSPLVLNEMQQQERFRTIIEQAIEELFGGDRQASWVRRLEDMAYFFHASGRAEQARSTYAAALALATSPRGGREVPLCEHLARTSMLAFWQVETQREAEHSRESLVVTPQQAAMEAERRRRGR